MIAHPIPKEPIPSDAARVTARDRLEMAARHQYGAKPEQIAEEWGIPIAAVKRALAAQEGKRA